MTLTIAIPARHDFDGVTERAIRSVLASLEALRIDATFVLIADHSDEQPQLLKLYEVIRKEQRRKVRIFRFRQWRHYTAAFALALATHDEGDVLFVSNDMIVTPTYLIALLAVAGLAPRAGIVRGTANFVDAHPQHSLQPNIRQLGVRQIEAFALERFQHEGLRYTVDAFLTGDAVLVKRALVREIGVLDLDFFGYFGDIDFGLRARLAGFELVCAKGAWLWHLGGADNRKRATRHGGEAKANAAREEQVERAYQVFRRKWRLERPETRGGLASFDFFDQVPRPLAAPLRCDLPAGFWDGVEEL